MKRALLVIVLLVLVAATSIGSVWAITGGPKYMRIASEVRNQLLLHLPKTMSMSGQSYSLQNVEISDFTEGPKGYEMKVIIDWSDGMKTWTSAVLQSDGFGRYAGQWNSADLGTFSYEISG